MRFYWHSTLLLSELKDICWSVFFQYFGTAVNTLDELAFHFLILPVLWKETHRNACFGLSILCAWVLHCSPVDKWTGTVIKRPPFTLHCPLLRRCTVVLFQWWNGSVQMARKEQYIFHKGSGHREDASIWEGRKTETKSGRARNGTMRCSMVSLRWRSGIMMIAKLD